MKVLECPTRPPVAWSAKRTCTGSGNGGGGCKAKLLVEAADLFLTREFEREGSGKAHATFRCPLCGKLTDLPTIPNTGKTILEHGQWKRPKPPQFTVPPDAAPGTFQGPDGALWLLGALSQPQASVAGMAARVVEALNASMR